MSSLVYILRSPLDTKQPVLYPLNDPHVVILGVESAVGSVVPSQPVEVLHLKNMSHFKARERLTYKLLLDVVVEAEKVVIL